MTASSRLLRPLPLPHPDALEKTGAMPVRVSTTRARVEALLADDCPRLGDAEALLAGLDEEESAPLDTPCALDHRQEHAIFDEFFHVRRHGGDITTLVPAVAQVLAETLRELDTGTSLSHDDRRRLVDGLRAVLEVVDEP